MSSAVTRQRVAMAQAMGDDSMVERVAKALALDVDCDPVHWEEFAHEARVAIAAMREPTEAMLKAFYGDMPVESRLGDDWRDMIDVALRD